MVVSDLQGHPRSMIFISSDRTYDASYKINHNFSRISHHFRDMASFLLKNAHLSYPTPFNPQCENVSPALDNWNFACQSFTYMANYSCSKFSSTT